MTECNCEELERRIQELESRLETLSLRKKRQANPYNLFIAKCLKEIEKEGPITERFKRCALRYKQGER
jgi:predicted transcriptional regulator